MHTHRMTRAVPAGRLRASRGQLCLCRCASRGFACDTEKFSGAVYITEHVCKAQHSIITLGRLPKDYPAAVAAAVAVAVAAAAAAIVAVAAVCVAYCFCYVLSGKGTLHANVK